MGNLVGLAVTYDDICVAVQYGLDESGNVAAIILVVAVGINDDVSPQDQAAIDPGSKGMAQAAVARKPDDVVSTVFECHRYGSIGASIIDDQDFDTIDTGNVPRNIADRGRQSRLFIRNRSQPGLVFSEN